MNPLHLVVDILYPPLCCACSRRLETRASRVCPRCWAALVRVDSSEGAFAELSAKLRSGGLVEEFASCYLYTREGPLHEIIHLLKYGGMRSLGIELGRMLAARLGPAYRAADALIPVPLHRLAERERGYNQSEAICRGLYQAAPIPPEREVLRRIRHTPSQTRLSLEERKTNVVGAFAARREAAAGRRFILIDDVVTTGATLQACAEALRAAGAASVMAASVAIAE